MKKLTVQQALTRAEAYLKKGDLDSARELYVDIIRRFPGNNKAVFGLALLDRAQHDQPVDREQLEKAIAFLGTLHNANRHAELAKVATQFIQKYPRSFELWMILAGAQNSLGLSTEAEKSFRKVIELKPDYAEAHSNLGVILESKGRLDDAISAHQSALEVNPQFYIAHFNLGNVYKDTRRLEDAVNSYRAAVAIMPFFAQAYIKLGIVLVDLYRLDEAILAYQHAITLEPGNASAYNNLGLALTEKGLFDDAIESYQKALSISRNYVEPEPSIIYNNLGICLHESGRIDEAIVKFHQSAELDPRNGVVYKNMGISLQDHGKTDEAIEAFIRALELDQNLADAYYGLGQAHLMKYDFYKGFKFYEWRWETAQIDNALKSSKPTWGGEKDRAILLWSEQGIGDEIMFSSVIPDLQSCCSKLIVQCDERLIPVFKRSFPLVANFKSRNELVQECEYDFQISMGSVQSFFRNSLDSFKISSLPYLRNNAEKSNTLRHLLKEGGENLIIGISWKTQSSKRAAQFRNIALEELATALCQDGTNLVNLQYGNVSQEISVLKHDFGIHISEFPDIDNFNNIEDLADLVSACDHVVSIDNALIHLAGALGVDTRVLLPFNPDWRWGVCRSTSYWYDSLKLYRQKVPNKWNETLNQLRQDIYYSESTFAK